MGAAAKRTKGSRSKCASGRPGEPRDDHRAVDPRRAFCACGHPAGAPRRFCSRSFGHWPWPTCKEIRRGHKVFVTTGRYITATEIEARGFVRTHGGL